MINLSQVPSVLIVACLCTSAFAQGMDLKTREAPRPKTTDGVPHVQIGIEADQVLNAELLRRVSEFPGVSLGPTRVSLPGATGFQLDNDMVLAQPDVIVGGREFAHLHPDGSLHASLSPELAKKAVATGWAIHHPWADQRPGWKGFVMIYTPSSMDELEVVFQLVEESYNFVTGQDEASEGL
jgi:phospholipase/carboxylesterase